MHVLRVTLTALQLHLAPLRVHGEERQVQRARQRDGQPASKHTKCYIENHTEVLFSRNGSSEPPQNDVTFFLQPSKNIP